MFFEGRTAAELSTVANGLGEMRTPTVADLFVAKMSGAGS
jgi:hypothetical protein